MKLVEEIMKSTKCRKHTKRWLKLILNGKQTKLIKNKLFKISNTNISTKTENNIVKILRNNKTLIPTNRVTVQMFSSK
jgi:hypothetical protein